MRTRLAGAGSDRDRRCGTRGVLRPLPGTRGRRRGCAGVRDSVAGTARPVVEQIRAVTDMPVALGFGISRPEHVRETCQYADAAVVGSALVQVIADAAPGDEARAAGAFVRWLKG